MQFVQACLLALFLSSCEFTALPAKAAEPALKKAIDGSGVKRTASPAASTSAAAKKPAITAPKKIPAIEPIKTQASKSLYITTPPEPNEAEEAPVRKRKHNAEPPNEDPTPAAVEGSGIFTNETAHTLSLEAKQLLRHHNYNKALRLLTKAIRLDDDDMECRVLYAEALDEKLNHQADKDPDIFNKCIKSWLMVARNEIGDEKGMTFKGLGIPGIAGRFADEDYALKAKKRLKVLTGYSPKAWETDNHYLKKVLKPAETSVSAVIKSTSESSEEEPVKIKSRPKKEE